MSAPTELIPLPEKYPTSIRLLHWAMAVGFLLLFIIGFIMVDLPKGDELRTSLFALHKSIGVISLILLVLRLQARRQATLPPPPVSLPPQTVQLAALIYKTLYGLMLIVPITGWAYADLHGRDVKLFGIPMPKLLPTVADIGSWPGELHGYLAYGMLALVALHVAGVLKHRYRENCDLLPRIL